MNTAFSEHNYLTMEILHLREKFYKFICLKVYDDTSIVLLCVFCYIDYRYKPK